VQADLQGIDGIGSARDLAALTRAALAQFQTFEMKRGPAAATGKLDADTRQALLSRHSS
jgi:hypothetical protein